MPEEPSVFYNVLPSERSNGQLVNGGIGAAAPAGAGEAPKINSTVSGTGKRKLPMVPIIAGVVVLIVVLVAGYFLYGYFHKTADPVVPYAPAVNTAPTAQPEGVTTPEDFQTKYFGTAICADVALCGDTADPDHDGLTNLEESQAATDPNNADSSGGGLADGDKVHVFGGDVLKIKTNNGDYTDADFVKYAYSIATNEKLTATELDAIKAKVQQYGLHAPTIATVGVDALAQYGFSASADQSQSTPINVDQSSTAKLDRDTQRLNTIKKIGIALVKYNADHKAYPATSDFNEMIAAIKPYVLVATNFTDPINQNQYIYGYLPGTKNLDFTLSYFSETQNLLIKYNAANAQADSAKESASAFDDQRTRDMENLQTALMLYSTDNIDMHGTAQYVFPPATTYKSALTPKYVTAIPMDPKTGKDYVYTVSDKFDSFTLTATLDNPPAGVTSFVCTEQGCANK